ncbi:MULTISPECIES: hypothetical protein [unclassified Thalassospira]|uniref:hypothetical protein n=1 Tax=unclassified Thalassospira TaxID=2648997 RepID=UPI0007A60DAF|nr:MULTISPECIES: hypothetical protein [unclassified Thalassospira]KZC99905.1 hypothetical protein AUQ41_09620 [Thalassospira sp. MCCC 1A02898]ONH86112.1 hypothetical protein TH47_18080 [Thalassospira sp. MCCC 1A02803]
MKFDITIWGEARDVIRKNLFIFAAVVATLWLLDIAIYAVKPEADSPQLPTYIVGAYLAIACHMTILRNVSGFTAVGALQKWAFFKFCMRGLAIVAVTLIPALFVMVPLFGVPEIKAASEEARYVLVFSVVLAFYGLGMLVVLSLVGTWLPAAIVADGSSLKRAFARGRKTIGYVAPRLIAGPGANILLFLATIFLLPAQFSVAIRTYTIQVGELNFVPFDIAVNGFGYLVWATGIVLVAVVLSRAYQLGEARLLKTDKQSEEVALADPV